MPESKPPDEPLPAPKYVQGFSKVDCVTEWEMLLAKTNVTLVPFGAVKFDGWYVSAPPGATTTLRVPVLDWALTMIEWNTAINARRKNFMVVGKGIPRQDDKGAGRAVWGVRQCGHFLLSYRLTG